MKNLINYRIAIIALFIGLGLSTATFANDEKKTSTPSAIEFKFIGKFQDKPVFQLNLNNTSGDEFVVSFRDNFGTVLYTNLIKGNFNQKFMINTEEVGDNVLTVEVRSKKTNKSEVFTIKRNQTLVDETVVAKAE